MINPDEIPIGIAAPLAVILWGWLILEFVRWMRREPNAPSIECTECGKSSGQVADLAECREWAKAHVLADHPDLAVRLDLAGTPNPENRSRA